MSSIGLDIVNAFIDCQDIQIEGMNLDELLEMFLKRKFLFPLKWNDFSNIAYFFPTQFFGYDDSILDNCDFRYVVDGIVYTVNGNGYILCEDEIKNKDGSLSYNTVITKLFEDHDIQSCFILREVVNAEKNIFNDRIKSVNDLAETIKDPRVEVLWVPGRAK